MPLPMCGKSDIEHRVRSKIGLVPLGMNAIYWAGVNARGILNPDARLSNDVCHDPLPFWFRE
jgi:hypothetical protein